MADLGAAMKKFPQVLLNVTVRDRDGLAEERSVWQAIREAEAALGDQGRVLVRASGTEPLIRVMVEAATEEQAAVQAEALARTVRTALG